MSLIVGDLEMKEREREREREDERNPLWLWLCSNFLPKILNVDQQSLVVLFVTMQCSNFVRMMKKPSTIDRPRM